MFYFDKITTSNVLKLIFSRLVEEVRNKIKGVSLKEKGCVMLSNADSVAVTILFRLNKKFI